MSSPNVCTRPEKSCSSGIFTLYPASSFPELPDMSWLIDDVLPSAGLASVYGPSGVGKSFISLDMAASIATGTPWFGHQTNPCRIVYIALEGQAGFRRRVAAWEKSRCISFPENMRFVFDQFSLVSESHRTDLVKAINMCGGAGLIIIDTLNKAAPGLDENSSSDMGKIIDAASTIQSAIGGMVLLVHHSGKDVSRGLRGHSSLHAALDTVIETAKDGQNIRWSLVKCKDGEDGIHHSFSLASVEVGHDQNGKVLKSCVVHEEENIAPHRYLNEPRGVNQKAIYIAVQEILLSQLMQLTDDTEANIEGLPFEKLLSEIKDVLDGVPTKHRQSRTKEALDGLVRQGFFMINEGNVCLPKNLRMEK